MESVSDLDNSLWTAVRIADGRVFDVLNTAAERGPSRDAFRDLINTLVFGRWFTPTYNLVLAAVLMLVTGWHWTGLLRLHFREKAKRRIREEASWSESSTLAGSSTHSSIDSREGERKPLLQHGPIRRRYVVRKWHRFCGWLMHQPPNVAVVDKVLPSNLTSIGMASFLGLNAFYLFYGSMTCPQWLFSLADRAGLLFAVNLPFLYLLAAKNAPVRRLTGYSYENLNIIHRRLGEVLALLAAIHGVAMLVVYLPRLQSRGETLIYFLTRRIVWTGLAALLSYEVLYLTSLASFRQRFYELFLASHILLHSAALAFLYFHYHAAQPYVLASLLIFLIDRLVYRLFLARTTLEADISVLPDGETLLLSASWPLRSGRSILSGWRATDHIFITLPALSRWQAHPFTIASPAPEQGATHARLDLLIRARGGMTRALVNAPSPTKVIVDGPYGSPHARHMLSSSRTAVLVAGGSGVAVTFPLAWELAHRQYAPRVVFVWIIREESHRSWLAAERLKELHDLGVRVVIPPATRTGGRPDVDALLHQEVGCVDGLGVVVSGPDALNREVRNWCARLRGRGGDVSVAVEKFGW